MKSIAPLLLLFVCGCGNAVAPDLTDGAVDGTAADVFPPCPTEYPGNTRCPRAGMRCSFFVTCTARTVPCVCEDSPPYPYPKWQGSCIVEPCA